MIEELTSLLVRALDFAAEAHALLSKHEASASRVVVLSDTYDHLAKFSLAQDELFREALHCAEHGLYRPAHVMAWAGFMDFIHHKVFEDGGTKLSQNYPKWQAATPEELREEVTDYQVVEACRKVGLCSKTEMKAVHALLNKRNECAHPSTFFPGINETLGFISEVLQRLGTMRVRKL